MVGYSGGGWWEEAVHGRRRWRNDIHALHKLQQQLERERGDTDVDDDVDDFDITLSSMVRLWVLLCAVGCTYKYIYTVNTGALLRTSASGCRTASRQPTFSAEHSHDVMLH